MSVKVITPASTFPVTLAQARTHLRLVPYGDPPIHPDDDYISTFLIPSATAWVEQYLDRALVSQTVELALNEFSDRVYLPLGNVQSVTSVKALIDGVETTVSTDVYGINDYSSSAYLYLKLNQVWPDIDSVDNAVKVRYVVGYTAVPTPIVSSIYLLIGHLYENRQQNVIGLSVNELPMGICSLLQTYRLNVGV
jgi:uncharacterized phiE125 gp8 family phage protein